MRRRLDRPDQALTLASMVEEEALKSERALMPGHHRAAASRHAPAIGSHGDLVREHYDGTIHTRDLQADNPYNTYTREGLPPGPIALPGRESLIAAVHPDESGALYFVATGLGDGAHHFSRTLEEHNSAVQTYLARLRAQAHAAASAAGTSPAARHR